MSKSIVISNFIISWESSFAFCKKMDHNAKILRQLLFSVLNFTSRVLASASKLKWVFGNLCHSHCFDSNVVADKLSDKPKNCLGDT